MTKTERVVCHFFHRDFERCRIMDKHLQALALQHFDTRFIKLSAPVSQGAGRACVRACVRALGAWSLGSVAWYKERVRRHYMREMLTPPPIHSQPNPRPLLCPRCLLLVPSRSLAGRALLCGEAAGPHAALRGDVHQRGGC